MNTAPTASAAPVRSDSASTQGSQAGQGEAPANAFDILFGSLFGAPMLLPAATPAKAPGSDVESADAAPLAGMDLGNWMQQLPLPPLQPTMPSAGDALAANSPQPPPVAALTPQLQAAADAAVLATQAEPAAELPALVRPSSSAPSQDLPALQWTPSPLAEVVTKALLRRTEVLQPSAPPAPLTMAGEATPSMVPESPLEVALPPGSAPKIEQAFTEGMAMRLQWMAQQQVGRAEIQLHPAELGAIDVQIEFDGKTVRAEFLSGSTEVRQLLETHLPRLRELLDAQGLQLQHASVGSGSGHGAHAGGHRSAHSALSGDAPAVAEDTQTAAPNRRAHHEGGLSEYA